MRVSIPGTFWGDKSPPKLYYIRSSLMFYPLSIHFPFLSHFIWGRYVLDEKNDISHSPLQPRLAKRHPRGHEHTKGSRQMGLLGILSKGERHSWPVPLPFLGIQTESWITGVMLGTPQPSCAHEATDHKDEATARGWDESESRPPLASRSHCAGLRCLPPA